jgi:hypothetical protein
MTAKPCFQKLHQMSLFHHYAKINLDFRSADFLDFVHRPGIPNIVIIKYSETGPVSFTRRDVRSTYSVGSIGKN